MRYIKGRNSALLPALLIALALAEPASPPPADEAEAGPEGQTLEGQTPEGQTPEGQTPATQAPAEEGTPSPSDDTAVPEAPPSPDEPPPALPEPPGQPEPTTGPTSAPASEPILWSAPVGCPDAAEMRGRVERRLGRRLLQDEVQVVGAIEATDAGAHRLSMRVVAGSNRESRSLEAEDCGALADAAALVVALAVDPIAVAETIAAARADEPPHSEEPAVVSPSPRPRRGHEPLPTRGFDGGLLRLDAGLGLGALPGATGTASLAGGVRWARARVEVHGDYWIPRRSTAVDGAQVRVQLGAAGVRGCGQLRRGRLEAPLCGGVVAGGMRGVGEGFEGGRGVTSLWLALELGVGLSWWFRPRWALAGGFTADVPLLQPGFVRPLDPPQVLFEPAPVAGRLWLGIELGLGRR